MDQAIGLNGFVDDPIDVLAVAGIVREYHSWEWDAPGGGDAKAYPDDLNHFAPNAGGWWNFDDYYAKFRSAPSAVVPAPVMQGSIAWLDPNHDAQPVPRGASTTDPRSYLAHADHLFQFAARYGSARVPDDRLKLAPGQPKKSGLGLIGYFEDWNEPNRFWLGKPGSPGNFSADELGAMLSADYDADCGALGDRAGVRTADPSARMVMAGLVGIDIAYLSAVKTWADAHRGGSFPADVINVHSYSRDPKETGVTERHAGGGISPEADGLEKKLRELVAWRDANLPGRELWLSEFGYDTHPNSPQRAPVVGKQSELVVQGEWLVRTLLASLAAGIDRAFIYMSRDVSAASSTQFSTSGLVYYGDRLPPGRKKHEPKPSWYFVATMKARLAGMVWSGKRESGDPRVMVYGFRSLTTHAGAYVVWAPSSNDTHVSGYRLATGRAADATLVELVPGEKAGKESKLVPRDGAVRIDVSERPVFVLVNDVGAE